MLRWRRAALSLAPATSCRHLAEELSTCSAIVSVRSFAAGTGTSRRDEKDPRHASSGSSPAQSSTRLMLDTKVSASGSADAAFQECIDAIRNKRATLERDRLRGQDPVYSVQDTSPIIKLRQDEIELTRKIFRRLDPSKDVTSELSHSEHHIDPYWSPFHKVRDTKEQVTAEFDEYARLVTAAEQKRVRIQIRRSLRSMASVYNPYSPEFKRHYRRQASDPYPKPFRLPDKHWEPTARQVQLSREKITWRDVDIIQHFMADNGYILPRRTTMLPRKKQQELVKAVKTAQNMALLPHDWRLAEYQAMPLMDPLQWMVDRLTDRVIEARDRRSRAMLRVMIERYPELNYRNFLKHEAENPRPLNPETAQATQHQQAS
eukprot:gnl/TRDRNA2_/TRDRNA2_185108_c0_seq1.p1 gnl/TRDRNA2_/TRDRNA2_185108_c0~~gnl/TRDRNA2_/TRDRNA2_185108_c0_seq1.p1  ORF type:complete len:391 (+),score=64.56 gnl/TRDRNA2_/TRDRNA2_185108_c0_seq1:50-1174(+)